MSLTVPKAGLTAGRSATIRTEAAGPGAAIAALGQTVQSVGARIEADRLDRAATRARIDMTRDLGELRNEVEQLNDPDEIDRAWAEGVKQLRDRIEGLGDDGRPIVDPKIRDRVALAFDDLTVRHGLALGKVAQAARTTRRAADWLEYSTELTSQAARVDDETAAELLAQGIEQINTDVANGTIDPLTGVQRRLALQEAAGKARAIELLNNDPAEFLRRTDAGETFGQEPDQVATWRGQAQGRIDRVAAEEARAAEAAAREREREIGAELANLRSILDDDRESPAIAMLDDPEVRAHPDYARTRAALDLKNERADLKFLTVDELDQLIEQERNRPVRDAWDTERLTVLQEHRDAVAKAWSSDPVAYESTIGLAPPQLLDPAQAEPRDLALAMVERWQFQGDVRDQGYPAGETLLSKDEAEAWRAAIAPGGDLTARASVVTALAALAAGDERSQRAASDWLGQLQPTRPFQVAAELAMAGGDLSVATAMLRGEDKIAAKTVQLPERRQLQLAFDEITGGILEDIPARKAAFLDAAAAIYADNALGIDPEEIKAGRFLADGDARAAWFRAVQLASGATPDRNGELTIGGIQDLGDLGIVALPIGVPRQDVTAIHAVVEQHLENRVFDADTGLWALDESADPYRALRAASPIGQTPDLGDRPWLTWRNIQFKAVPGGLYELREVRGGRSYTITDQEGRAYRFDLEKLIGEAAR